jgi:peptidoglycan/LPS O-acetylase OafA/YrhL
MADQDTTSSRRIVQLDGLRAIAVLMVFLGHAFRSRLLWTGVDLFFILSGFLITGILLEQRGKKRWRGYLASFYERRARRILPPYLLFLVLTSMLFGIGWLRRWYLFLFLMNTAPFWSVAKPYYFGLLWTLAIEEQFYLVWPLAVYLLDEVALAWLAGSIVLAAPALRWIATAFFPGHWSIYTSTPFRMDLLAAGALIAIAWRHRRSAVERLGRYGPVLAGLAAAPLLWLSRFSWFQPGTDTVLVNVWLYELSLIGYVGVMGWALSGSAVGALKLRPLVYVGRISYSLYLVHPTALAIVRRHYLHHYTLTAAIALALSFVYAGLSWRFLERPLLQRRRQEAPPGTKSGSIPLGAPTL